MRLEPIDMLVLSANMRLQLRVVHLHLMCVCFGLFGSLRRQTKRRHSFLHLQNSETCQFHSTPMITVGISMTSEMDFGT